MAYNFAKRPKTLGGFTPNVCKVWTTQPKRFRPNPLHRTVGDLEHQPFVRFVESIYSPQLR
jgi:hypothetical protein